MPIVFRAITANCGTDTLGETANQAIVNLLREDGADFFVINCQEAKYQTILTELQQAVGEDYKVTMLGKMNTYTKGISFTEGMASFIVHKKNISVAEIDAQEARRSNFIMAGAAYNKGGMISDFLLKKGSEEFHLQTVTGHLDSTSLIDRMQDWLVILKALAKPVSGWDQLVKIMPSVRLSGYDANTRNRLQNDRAVNQWLSSSGSSEIQGLQQANIDNHRYSRPSTYKTHLGEKLNKEDDKRPGYAIGGTLDFVGISDGGDTAGIDVSTATPIAFDITTQRDHDVLISPLKTYHMQSDFNVVRGQIATRLAIAAPMLSQDIKNLSSEDPGARSQLLIIYRSFLSHNGLLNTELALFKDKLATVGQVAQPLQKDITALLFSSAPWFESSRMTELGVDEIRSLQNSMHDVLTNSSNPKGLLYTEKVLLKDKLMTMDKMDALPIPAWLKKGIRSILFASKPWFESSRGTSLSLADLHLKQSNMRDLVRSLNQNTSVASISNALLPYTQHQKLSSEEHVSLHRARGMKSRFQDLSGENTPETPDNSDNSASSSPASGST